jgi:hypothetical protein
MYEGLRIESHARRTGNRDDIAPYGWAMTLYRTLPIKTSHGIGVESTPLDTAWFTTHASCRDAAHHIGYALNGDRVPSSSFGWTGKVGSPDGSWRYGFRISGEPLFHGHAVEWRAVGTVADHSPVQLYTADLGPIRPATAAPTPSHALAADVDRACDQALSRPGTSRDDAYAAVCARFPSADPDMVAERMAAAMLES